MLSETLIEAGWPAPANVRAYSTTRRGGVSLRPYDSLNLAFHVGDEPRRVEQNRKLLRSELDLPSEPVWLEQKHGRGVVPVDRADPRLPLNADAAVATRPGRICVVMTADCVPVLLCNRAGSRVGAVHAGWRGLAAGVVEAAVAAMRVPGPELDAWLGPAIGPQAYEIDTRVRRALLATDAGGTAAMNASRPGHWRVDLAALTRRRLESLGVRVHGGGFCTHTDSSRFYSHRRDGVCGRMATLIWFD